MERMIEKFYGRIKARELTDRQIRLYDTLFNDVSINSITEIDKNEFNKVFLEVGFGGGEHIAQQALMDKESLFIGSEPFVNGVASLLVKIDDNNSKNIRIFQDDARKLIREIPDNSLDGMFLLFPDPWPKRKHFKRRFVQDETIKEAHRILKKGASWKIATDHADYGQWILRMFDKDPFDKMFSKTIFNKANRPGEDVWPKTRYEQKSLGDICFIIYTKI